MVCTITLQTNPAASGSGRSRHCRGSGFVDTVADRCSSANALTATAGNYSPATPSATNTPSRYTSAILGGGRRNAHPSTGAISSAGIRRRFARSDRAARASRCPAGVRRQSPLRGPQRDSSRGPPTGSAEPRRTRADRAPTSACPGHCPRATPTKLRRTIGLGFQWSLQHLTICRAGVPRSRWQPVPSREGQLDPA